MSLEIIDLNTRDKGSKYAKVESSLICPHCFEKIPFSPIYISKLDTRLSKNFFISLQCIDCQHYSIFEYHINNMENDKAGFGISPYSTTLIEYSYNLQIKVTLPENIDQISSAFIRIYKQAAMAEAYGLNDICGLGYRKSAEFLIKDYAIKLNPEEIDDVKARPLNQVIQKYLSDFPKIQTLAKATAWLGNDEAHYIRKHDDKDLSDLKRFITATATFIVADFDADIALNFVSE